MENRSTFVAGYVEKILFHNDDNGYTVLDLDTPDGSVTLTGTFFSVSEGEYLKVTGQMKKHPIYGDQMQVESCEYSVPEDAASIERYLASGAVKGIGQTMAKRIVEQFGDDTFRIIEEEPERLTVVKGISERKAVEISASVTEKREMREAMLFLQQYGISLNLAAKIYQCYGNSLFQVIRENPYRMAEEIDGVGFRIADGIAKKAGILVDSDYRIRSGILYTLEQAMSEGHTCLPKEILLREGAKILEVEEETVESQLGDLLMDQKIVIRKRNDAQMIYRTSFYQMELAVSRKLHDLNITGNVPADQTDERIGRIEQEEHLTLDEGQREAVQKAANHGLLILTGGPGTGKTTTINTMIRYFLQEGRKISLAAPTGRAAKRMKETTGYDAQTIHRLLEVSGNPEDAGTFARNEDNPLTADVLIIDEMSMVDLTVMNALLKAVTIGTRLILVGDVDQLPSVGPGNVLKDIISSGCFPVVRLTKIFRQASESDIIVNAHRINRGEVIEPDPKSRDFIFVKRDRIGSITGATITLVKDKLPRYIGGTPNDIQVLTPMRKGNLGVEQLNRLLQENLNPPSPDRTEKEFAGFIFREGDKVMQIRNNYQLAWEIVGDYNILLEQGTGIFNGDIGTILSINLFTEELTVEFDDKKRVNYPFSQMDELELAYAVTIHKSQGSEYPAVVLPLFGGPKMLMTRNLLYTAVTRAKTCVTIVGSVRTFQAMIENESEQKRYSGLCEALKEMDL